MRCLYHVLSVRMYVVYGAYVLQCDTRLCAATAVSSSLSHRSMSDQWRSAVCNVSSDEVNENIHEMNLTAD